MLNQINGMKTNEIMTNVEQLKVEQLKPTDSNEGKLSNMENSSSFLYCEREKSLLHAIRCGKYDQIVIDFKDKRMSALSLIRDHDTNRKIVDVLRESDFQEVTVKSHQGRIVRLLNTIKVKFS